MEAICKVNTHQSTGLEKTITVFRGNAGLGMTLNALEDGSGISIRSVVNGGTISKDGRLKVGDGILAINGEPTTNLTNAQARALLRKQSLIGPELSVTYVPAAFLDMHRAIKSKQDIKTSQATVISAKQKLNEDLTTVIQSKLKMKMDQTPVAQSLYGNKTRDADVTRLGYIPEKNKVEGGRGIERSCKEKEKKQSDNTALLRCKQQERKNEQERKAKDRMFSLQIKEWRKEEPERETTDKRQRCDRDSWKHPRKVTLIRTNGESLGISVIGGRGMGRRLSNGEMRRGIFIKHITEHSPAARDNTLTPGDQILQVCGMDVSDCTHEEAVEAIRQAGEKVELLVQSLQMCEDANRQTPCLSPTNHVSPVPYKLTGSNSLKIPPLPTAPPPSRLPSGPVSLLTERVTSKNGLERQSGSSESTQHCQQGQVSSWGNMVQKYGSLPGELKLVELDCSKYRSGLGLCLSGSTDGRMAVYVSKIQTDGAAAADGQISVGDELLEINGQVLYDQSYQNATTALNSAPAKTKIVLIRNKAAKKHTAVGSIMEAESNTIRSPIDVDINMNKDHKHDATVIQEERMRLDKQTPCQSMSNRNNPPVSFITLFNKSLHEPASSFLSVSPISATSHVLSTSHSITASHTHALHHKQPHHSSLINPYASGVQKSSYCSATSVRSDHLTCPIIPGCIITIDICKGHSSLGLTIVGGSNTLLGVILIHEVNEGGAAQRDGRLMAGDQILEVNGIDLRMASHEEALSVLRLSPQHVRLCVYRHTSTDTFQNQAILTHEDLWDLFTVDLQLQPGQELGLNTVGKRNDIGIFVSEISQGGVAESDGRLALGDQILSINGEDIRTVTQDYVQTLLQNCSGSVVLQVARFHAAPHHSFKCQNNLPGQ